MRTTRSNRLLALWLMGLLVLAGTAARAADDTRAEEIVQGKCFICHGAEGESSSPVFPRLAGRGRSCSTRRARRGSTARSFAGWFAGAATTA